MAWRVHALRLHAKALGNLEVKNSQGYRQASPTIDDANEIRVLWVIKGLVVAGIAVAVGDRVGQDTGDRLCLGHAASESGNAFTCIRLHLVEVMQVGREVDSRMVEGRQVKCRATNRDGGVGCASDFLELVQPLICAGHHGEAPVEAPPWLAPVRVSGARRGSSFMMT